MLPHCAINRPKKNQVGFRISQVKLDTPTTQTPKNTIHSFCGKGGNRLSDSARKPSKAKKCKTDHALLYEYRQKSIVRSGRLRRSGFIGANRFSQNAANSKPERVRSHTQERMRAEKLPSRCPDDRTSCERAL